MPRGDYTAVFTANATGALKLVGEAYPFTAGSRLLLTVDNHNSVNGIREFACARGAAVEYAPLTFPELRIDRDRLGTLSRRRGFRRTPICSPFPRNRTSRA